MAAGTWPPPGLANLPNFTENALPYLNWNPTTGNLGAPTGLGAGEAQALYTGGARGALGATPLAESAASLAPEAAGGVRGLLGQGVGALKSNALGGAGSLAEAGGALGVAKGMLARGAKGGIPIYIGSRLAGEAADQLGAPAGTGDAIRGMGSGAATGFTVAGPPGAVVGQAVGGLMEVGKTYGELGDAESYDKTAGQFQKQINSKALSGTKIGNQFVRVARHIHNTDQGVPYTDPATGQSTTLPTGTIAEKNAAMKVLVDQMKQARTAKKQDKGSKVDDLALQAQASEWMKPYADQSINLGNALADSIMAQVPNVSPQMAPILQYDAAQRRAFGAQTANAYRALPYAQSVVNSMNAQLAYLAQAQQQAQSQQIGQTLNPGGSSGSQSLAQLAQQQVAAQQAGT